MDTDTNLTFDKLEGVYDQLFPITYYGTNKECKKGEIILVKESVGQPRFIVFHPDDLDDMKSLDIRLVHLKDMSDRECRKYLMESIGQYCKTLPIDTSDDMCYNVS